MFRVIGCYCDQNGLSISRIQLSDVAVEFCCPVMWGSVNVVLYYVAAVFVYCVSILRAHPVM
jgi:hypothetical protein